MPPSHPYPEVWVFFEIMGTQVATNKFSEKNQMSEAKHLYQNLSEKSNKFSLRNFFGFHLNLTQKQRTFGADLFSKLTPNIATNFL